MSGTDHQLSVKPFNGEVIEYSRNQTSLYYVNALSNVYKKILIACSNSFRKKLSHGQSGIQFNDTIG